MYAQRIMVNLDYWNQSGMIETKFRKHWHELPVRLEDSTEILNESHLFCP